jgi:uncharacterized protein YukE
LLQDDKNCLDRKLFFENFIPTVFPKKSFSQLINMCYAKNNLVGKLNKNKEEIELVLSKKNNELSSQSTTLSQGDTLIQEWNSFVSDKKQTWQGKNNEIFNNWKMQLQDSSNILLESVVIPWFDKKIKGMKIKSPTLNRTYVKVNKV